MSSTFSNLFHKGLLRDAPRFLDDCVQYEVIMGSMAYGVSSDTSDMDVYGFAIPPKEMLFPHLRGEIPGFDECKPQFDQYQQHHVLDASALGGKGREYDLTLYSITKYFRLLTDNNPNIIDSLWVPHNCILYSTPLADRIREKRKVFLHKGCWLKFKGYAYAQIRKLETKQPEGKRRDLVEKYGYDVKFAYHVVRLLNEVEQLMLEQDLDLQRNNEQLKSIRNGEWTFEQLQQYFVQKEKDLESLYTRCELPATPDMAAIRSLLMESLEQYYGSIDKLVVSQDRHLSALRSIESIIADLGLD